jgi:hypothetical protein
VLIDYLHRTNQVVVARDKRHTDSQVLAHSIALHGIVDGAIGQSAGNG